MKWVNWFAMQINNWFQNASIFRSSRSQVSLKTGVLKFLEISMENTYVGVSFLNKLKVNIDIS